MHLRRLACLLLGAWIAGSLFMAWVATQNFKSVDRLLERPHAAAAKSFDAIGGRGAARDLLRYQVSEQNRWYFENWDTAQIALGLAVLAAVAMGSTRDRIGILLAGLMLAAALAERLVLTPEIVSLGRAIDFLPADAPSAERTRFWMLHSAYSTTEVVKWILGLVLALKLLAKGHRSHSRREADE